MKHLLISSTSVFLMILISAANIARAESVEYIPNAMHYGSKLVDVCLPKRICAINQSDRDIADPGFSSSNPRVFRLQEDFQDCPNPLKPGDACIVYVDFCPEAVTDYSETLNFSGSESAVQMTGYGVSARF